MTLLVLDLHIPTAACAQRARIACGSLRHGSTVADLWDEFFDAGNFLGRRQTQLNHIGEGTRDLTWIHLGFLFSITLMPLSTRLLAEFIEYRLALGLYWLTATGSASR
jgi:uncharacterized membrane protein